MKLSQNEKALRIKELFDNPAMEATGGFNIKELLNYRDYAEELGLLRLKNIVQSKIDYKISNELKKAFKSTDNK